MAPFWKNELRYNQLKGKSALEEAENKSKWCNRYVLKIVVDISGTYIYTLTLNTFWYLD